MTPVLAALRESLLLEDAERRAAAYTADQAAEIERFAEAARSHAAVARELGAPRDDATRVALLRDALRCWKHACVAATGNDTISIRDDDRAIIERALDVTDAAMFETWPREDLEVAADALARAVRRASHSFVWRSRAMIRTMRLARFAALALFVVLVAWRVAHAIVTPPNVALGRRVAASGLAMGSATPDTLVDGVGESRTPVVTGWGPGAWIAVDLGASFMVRTVRLVNRQDRGFDEGLPFWIDVSSDGEHFTPAVKHRDHFRTWTYDVPPDVGAWVRAVRIRCVTTCSIGLNELEVRGRPAR